MENVATKKTAKKAAKKKSATVMLGARISPKAHYGVRLLAKVQGRSIAETVEWAINLAMRTTRVGAIDDEVRLADLVNTAWKKESEPERIRFLYGYAPELLDFEERSAWNLVLRCDELAVPEYFTLSTLNHSDGSEEIDYVQVDKDAEDRDTSLDRINFNDKLIELHWQKLREVGVALGEAGELSMRFTLEQILSGEALTLAGVELP